MPTIVIASPKGGSGKSTTAVLLGTELAKKGVPIIFIDTDPNKSLTLWSNQAPLPDNITIFSDITESNIIKKIKENDEDGRVVIVDLEGVASRMTSRAISQADLVITPMKATTLDASIGATIIQLISEEEEVLNRKIKHSVVFTMTKGISSKQNTEIISSFYEQGIDVIEPSLMERSAFSALFHFGGNLDSIPAQGNMEKALENAEKFMINTLNRLQG